MIIGNTYYIFDDHTKEEKLKCIYCFNVSVVEYPFNMDTWKYDYYIIKDSIKDQKFPNNETKEIYESVINDIVFKNSIEVNNEYLILENSRLFINIDIYSPTKIIITHNKMNNSSMRYIDSSETEHWIDYKNDNLILLENNFELITKDDIQKYQNNECIYEYLAIPFETNDKLEKLKSYIRSHCLNVIYTNTCSYIFQKDTYEYLKSFYILCTDLPKIKKDFYLFRGLHLHTCLTNKKIGDTIESIGLQSCSYDLDFVLNEWIHDILLVINVNKDYIYLSIPENKQKEITLGPGVLLITDIKKFTDNLVYFVNFIPYSLSEFESKYIELLSQQKIHIKGGSYYNKYLKYKNKYLQLKKQLKV